MNVKQRMYVSLVLMMMMMMMVICLSVAVEEGLVGSLDRSMSCTPIQQLSDLRGGKYYRSGLERLWFKLKSLLGFPNKNNKKKYRLPLPKSSKSKKKSAGLRVETELTKVSPLAAKSKAKVPKISSTPTGSGMSRLFRVSLSLFICRANCHVVDFDQEIQSFLKDPPTNLALTVDPNNVRSWVVTMTGAEGTVYAGEQYKLQLTFPKDYPSKPPSAYFLKPIPKHIHVYSNGDICLNLLGKGWSPMLTGETLSLSILSMLSSAKEKSSPTDSLAQVDNPPGGQQDNWMYHDDRC
jgi:ubiquitin-protein ligase